MGNEQTIAEIDKAMEALDLDLRNPRSIRDWTVRQIRAALAASRAALTVPDKPLPPGTLDIAELVKALELSQKWLANCIPVCEISGPKPLPVIAAALAKHTAEHT